MINSQKYAASCSMRFRDNTYDMECVVDCGDGPIKSSYVGKDFAEGVNKISSAVNDVIDKKQKAANANETKIKELEAEIAKLNKQINELKAEPKRETKKKTYSVDDILKFYTDVLNEAYKEQKSDGKKDANSTDDFLDKLFHI